MPKAKDQIAGEVRTMSDVELARLAKLGVTGFRQVTAEQELKRREFWREFWTRGIVAWMALVISILSLAISLFRADGA